MNNTEFSGPNISSLINLKEPLIQTHVHEITGNVKIQTDNNGSHNHHFSAVSSEAIPILDEGHKHAFLVNTDFLDHHHEISGETGPAINVGAGKHVHLALGQTTTSEKHSHSYIFTTLIDSPLLPK